MSFNFFYQQIRRVAKVPYAVTIFNPIMALANSCDTTGILDLVQNLAFNSYLWVANGLRSENGYKKWFG